MTDFPYGEFKPQYERNDFLKDATLQDELEDLAYKVRKFALNYNKSDVDPKELAGSLTQLLAKIHYPTWQSTARYTVYTVLRKKITRIDYTLPWYSSIALRFLNPTGYNQTLKELERVADAVIGIRNLVEGWKEGTKLSGTETNQLINSSFEMELAALGGKDNTFSRLRIATLLWVVSPIALLCFLGFALLRDFTS